MPTTVPRRPWYLRFVCLRDGKGFFQIAYRLRGSRTVPTWDRRELERQIEWFSENLLTPYRFARSRGPSSTNGAAVCWFKDSAAECLRHAWDVAHVLERNDVVLELRRADNPGYIVFEDENQVAAIPLRDR